MYPTSFALQNLPRLAKGAKGIGEANQGCRVASLLCHNTGMVLQQPCHTDKIWHPTAVGSESRLSRSIQGISYDQLSLLPQLTYNNHTYYITSSTLYLSVGPCRGKKPRAIAPFPHGTARRCSTGRSFEWRMVWET